MRIEKEFAVQPGQKFTVERFRPEDAPGLANLFLSVYGPGYPVDLYYDPERIIEAHEKGDAYAVVCRTATGDVVAGGWAYRSAPVNPMVYEVGLYMVLVPYRTTSAAYRVTKYIGETLVPAIGGHAIFGEAVMHHTASQKVSRMLGGTETAIELLLMPAAIYEKEQSTQGRASCVTSFRVYEDLPQTLYVPERYGAVLRDMIARMNLTRELVSAPGNAAADTPSVLAPSFYDSAGVQRVNLSVVGGDLAARVEEMEAEADRRNIVVRQWFIDLTDRAAEGVVALLRRKGFFFGGYLPRWFGGDGLFMQKLLEEPDFDSLRVHSQDAAALLAFIRNDRV